MYVLEFCFILMLFSRFDLAEALLVFTSSVLTASMASFCLGIIMIGVIIGKTKNCTLGKSIM